MNVTVMTAYLLRRLDIGINVTMKVICLLMDNDILLRGYRLVLFTVEKGLLSVIAIN